MLKAKQTEFEATVGTERGYICEYVDFLPDIIAFSTSWLSNDLFLPPLVKDRDISQTFLMCNSLYDAHFVYCLQFVFWRNSQCLVIQVLALPVLSQSVWLAQFNPSHKPLSSILFTKMETKIRVDKSEGSLKNKINPSPLKILGLNKITK